MRFGGICVLRVGENAYFVITRGSNSVDFKNSKHIVFLCKSKQHMSIVSCWKVLSWVLMDGLAKSGDMTQGRRTNRRQKIQLNALSYSEKRGKTFSHRCFGAEMVWLRDVLALTFWSRKIPTSSRDSADTFWLPAVLTTRRSGATIIWRRFIAFTIKGLSLFWI